MSVEWSLIDDDEDEDDEDDFIHSFIHALMVSNVRDTESSASR